MGENKKVQFHSAGSDSLMNECIDYSAASTGSRPQWSEMIGQNVHISFLLCRESNFKVHESYWLDPMLGPLFKSCIKCMHLVLKFVHWKLMNS